MSGVVLRISQQAYEGLMRHLLPPAGDEDASEQAAFAFARGVESASGMLLSVEEYLPIATAGFAHQSGYHIELTDETRATVIKRAHDLRCSLVEFHCHLGTWPAQFSASDLAGFREFVPHVWWRLRGRPYVAVVVADSGFDALSWVSGADCPELLTAIEVDGQRLTPTGLSSLALQRRTAWTA